MRKVKAMISLKEVVGKQRRISKLRGMTKDNIIFE
jgi:hypothetical protein